MSLFLCGCGRKGPPQIPIPIVPEKITDLSAKMVCEGVELKFSPPKRNTDKTPFYDIYCYKIYRKDKYRIETLLTPTPLPTISPLPTALEASPTLSSEILTSSAVKTPLPTATKSPKAEKYDWNESPQKLIATLMANLASYDTVETGKIYYIDKKIGPKYTKTPRIKDKERTAYLSYEYNVVTLNMRKKTSEMSNSAFVEYGLIPSPPENLRTSLSENNITISWDKVEKNCRGEKIEGEVFYNLYKGLMPDFVPDKPINNDWLKDNFYNDKEVIDGKVYYYRVRAVLNNPFRESLDSPQISEIYLDIYPPHPPQNIIFTVNQKEGKVSFIWEKNKESDIAGYNIYRRAGTGGFIKLNSTLILSNTFIDMQPLSGTSYYVLTAVDNAILSNESEFSKEIKVNF